MRKGCWEFLDDLLQDRILLVDQTDVHILVCYAVETLYVKNKLPSRSRFMEVVKSRLPEPGLWDGLD
jgi:hypothetical protein